MNRMTRQWSKCSGMIGERFLCQKVESFVREPMRMILPYVSLKFKKSLSEYIYSPRGELYNFELGFSSSGIVVAISPERVQKVVNLIRLFHIIDTVDQLYL